MDTPPPLNRAYAHVPCPFTHILYIFYLRNYWPEPIGRSFSLFFLPTNRPKFYQSWLACMPSSFGRIHFGVNTRFLRTNRPIRQRSQTEVGPLKWARILNCCCFSSILMISSCILRTDGLAAAPLVCCEMPWKITLCSSSIMWQIKSTG